MPLIKGIQRREPYSHSASEYSDYDRCVNCAEFVVKRQSRGDEVEVNIFFPRLATPSQGVGLSIPSPDIAIAVGRALPTVAEGYSSEMRGRF